MIKFKDQYVSKIAIGVVIGGITLVSAAAVADPDMGHPAPLTKQEKGIDRVDERIRTLHEKLNITDEQEGDWRKVAHIIRENERAIHRLIKARLEMESESAIVDLKSYEEFTRTHEEGLEKLIPAFEKFYNHLTPEQKVTADDLFSKHEKRQGREEGENKMEENTSPAPVDEGTEAPMQKNNIE